MRREDVVAVTSAPSSERTQHAEAIEAPRVDARVFRQGWLVRTRLDALFADGHIDADIWQAAREYRHCVERSSPLASGLRLERSSGESDAHARQWKLSKAARRVREVEAWLGPDCTRFCRSLVVEDCSWRKLGRETGCDRESARRIAPFVLQSLWWGWTHPKAP
jgi:hypothetical protein